MSPKFYLSRSRRKGPYGLRQILTFVIRGQISIEQELYRLKKNKLQKPVPLYKNLEFKKFFSHTSLEKSWILLKKNQQSFVQSGPYRKQGIQTLLRVGLVSDTDFVYTEGMKEWERISICSEFYTPLSSTLEDWMDKIAQGESTPTSEVIYTQSESWSQWRK